jgi:hypothetical protein
MRLKNIVSVTVHRYHYWAEKIVCYILRQGNKLTIASLLYKKQALFAFRISLSTIGYSTLALPVIRYSHWTDLKSIRQKGQFLLFLVFFTNFCPSDELFVNFRKLILLMLILLLAFVLLRQSCCHPCCCLLLASLFLHHCCCFIPAIAGVPSAAGVPSLAGVLVLLLTSLLFLASLFF